MFSISGNGLIQLVTVKATASVHALPLAANTKRKMLDILNREVQRKLFSEDNPEILISFLNGCFFQNKEKIIEIISTDDLSDSFIHLQSCFQDTIVCKVKTSTDKILIIQIDVIRVHNGKDTSLIKLRDKYFDMFMKLENSYAYELPLIYIGLFTFDFGELKQFYNFKKSRKNEEISLHLLNLEKWKVPKKDKFSVFEQWMYLFKKSKSIASLPKEINDKNLLSVITLLDSSTWDTKEIKYYLKDENQWEKRNNNVLDMYKKIGSPLIYKYINSPSTEVKMSITPLFIQLTQEENNIRIELGRFPKEELQKTAFDTFRKWLISTNKKYPDISISIKDERKIVEDFKITLVNAIKSLILTDKLYMDYVKGWDIGYVFGYITGSLSIKWHNEYVIKQTNDFKVLTMVQVIRDYLKFNDTLKIQLKDIYEKFIEGNINLQGFDNSIELEKFEYKGEIIEGRTFGKSDTIIAALENIVNTQTHRVINENKMKAVDFRIDDIFSLKIIENLIKENKSAANNA